MDRKPITDADIADVYAKRCHKCQYRGPENGAQCCDYILHTGHMRGCSILECDKFVKGRKLKVGEPANSPIQRKRREITKPKRNADKRRKKPAQTEVGGLIDAYCQTHGLYIMDFAKEIGASRSAVSAWRMGKQAPKEETLKRLRDVIGVDMDTLMSDMRKEKAE